MKIFKLVFKIVIYLYIIDTGQFTKEFYPAQITNFNKVKNTYNVRYKTGERVSDIPRKNIKSLTKFEITNDNDINDKDKRDLIHTQSTGLWTITPTNLTDVPVDIHAPPTTLEEKVKIIEPHVEAVKSLQNALLLDSYDIMLKSIIFYNY
jgi:hypothetical protein